MMDTIDELPREANASEDPILAITADPKGGNSTLLMLPDPELQESSVTLGPRNPIPGSSYEQS